MFPPLATAGFHFFLNWTTFFKTSTVLFCLVIIESHQLSSWIRTRRPRHARYAQIHGFPNVSTNFLIRLRSLVDARRFRPWLETCRCISRSQNLLKHPNPQEMLSPDLRQITPRQTPGNSHRHTCPNVPPRCLSSRCRLSLALSNPPRSTLGSDVVMTRFSHGQRSTTQPSYPHSSESSWLA